MTTIRKSMLAAAAALLALPATMQAVPAYPGLLQVTQPDGTTLQVRMTGDEYGHFFVTADNHLLVRDGNAFYYAVAGADISTPLVSTGVLATDAAARTPETRAMLASIDTDRAMSLFNGSRAAVIESQKAAHPVINGKPSASRLGQEVASGRYMSTTNVPTLGKQKALLVLVQYKDVKFTVEDPHTFFNRMVNEEGFNDYGNTGSVRDFFKASSKGLYEPDFDVYGPVTVSQNRVFYGGNAGGSNSDARPASMAAEAMQLAAEQNPDVDFSQYDTDKDGFIDNITIIYAGDGEATSGNPDEIWPHAGYLYSGSGINVGASGVKADRYNCINEWLTSENRPMGIGTIVHEFSHILGLTDLYDTAYSTAVIYSPGAWSVMDAGPYNNNGFTPPLHSAFEAYCLDWTTPLVIDKDCEAGLNPHGGSFYIATDKENEFFILEARKRTGWDEYLPGDGMLIWHIDYNQDIWHRNTPNNNPSHHYIDLIEADGRIGEATRKNDAWPGQRGQFTEFNTTTKPAFMAWSGYDMGLPLSDIRRNEWGKVTFKVGKGGESVGIDAIEATDNAADSPVEWFTLQGVRVDNPVAGNIYLRRQGSQVTKQLVK